MTKARKPGAGAVPRFFYTIDGVSYSTKAYCEARGLTDKLSVTRVGSIMSNYRGSPDYETNLAAKLLKQAVTRALRKLKDKQQQEATRATRRLEDKQQQEAKHELKQDTIHGETPPEAQQLLQRFARDILEALKPQLRAPMESYAAALKKRAELFAEFCKTKDYIKELKAKIAQAETYSEQLQDKYAKNREEREELEILLRNVDRQDS